MTPVIPGRFTAQMDEPFVDFLIGMRVNRPLAFGKWIATARAMGPMVRELQQHPQKGLLGVEQFFYWPGQRWFSTGAPSRIWSGLRGTRTILTSPPGTASTRPSALTGAWVFGTRPMRSSQATTRRSTITCRSSARPRRPSMCQPRIVWRLPGAA